MLGLEDAEDPGTGRPAEQFDPWAPAFGIDAVVGCLEVGVDGGRERGPAELNGVGQGGPARQFAVPLVEDHQGLGGDGNVGDQCLGLGCGDLARDGWVGVVLGEDGSSCGLAPVLDHRVLLRCGDQGEGCRADGRGGAGVLQGAGEFSGRALLLGGPEGITHPRPHVGEDHRCRDLHGLGAPHKHAVAVLPDDLTGVCALLEGVSQAVLDAMLLKQSGEFRAHGGSGLAVHQMTSNSVASSSMAKSSSTCSSSTP